MRSRSEGQLRPAPRCGSALALRAGVVAILGILALAGTTLAQDEREPIQILHYLPVADPVHDDIESLAISGDVQLPSLFARPLGRYALARALAARSGTLRPIARQRAEEELVEERYEEGAHTLAPLPTAIRIDDDDARLDVSAFARYQAEASPERGFVNTDSTRVGLRFRLDLMPGFHFFQELYLANIENGRIFADPIVADSDIVVFQDRTFASLHTRYLDFVLGRDRLQWAPGRTGTLLLSGTHRPFTHLRFERSFLGRFHIVVVNGVLSGAENRYVAFHRLDWQMHRTFRLGLSEGARYQSNNVEPLYLLGIIPYPFVQRLLERDLSDGGRDDRLVRNNVMWSLDSSWMPRPGTHVYGEVLIDDLGTEASQVPTRIAYQFGAQQVASMGSRELRLRAEWTRVWRYVYSVFYGANFEHQGVPLGYPLGPDSRNIHLNADLHLDRVWSVGATVERIDRGENRIGDYWDPDDATIGDADASQFQGVVERQLRFLGRLGITWNRHLMATLELGYADYANANHQAGKSVDGLTGRVVVSVWR